MTGLAWVRRLAWMVVLAWLVAIPIRMGAHDVQYAGTVVRTEPQAVHVRTVATQEAPETTIRFAVTAETRVQRGDQVVAYAEADVADGERIVVVVDHDATTPNVATEIRLRAR